VLRRALVALLLAVPLVATGGTAEAAACSSSTTGVTVVVQFPDSHTEIGCASGNPATGFAALGAAGFAVDYVTGQPFVCRINQAPANADCSHTPPTNAYWAYFHARRGGSWAYSSEGAGSYDPPPGSVEGWRFGGGAAPTTKPPGTTPSPTPSPKPTPRPTPSARPTAGTSAKATAGPTAVARSRVAEQKAQRKGKMAMQARKARPTAAASATADPSASPGATSVTGASHRTTAPAAEAQRSGSLPWWWGVVALVGLGGAAGGVTLLRRRSP
jgi:hypothetical protein